MSRHELTYMLIGNDRYLVLKLFHLWNSDYVLNNIFNHAGKISCYIALQATQLYEQSNYSINASSQHGTTHKNVDISVQSV